MRVKTYLTVKRIIENCLYYYDVIDRVNIIGSKNRYIIITYNISRITENTDDKHIGKYIGTEI